jgi:hypothetical protein
VVRGRIYNHYVALQPPKQEAEGLTISSNCVRFRGIIYTIEL